MQTKEIDFYNGMVWETVTYRIVHCIIVKKSQRLYLEFVFFDWFYLNENNKKRCIKGISFLVT